MWVSVESNFCRRVFDGVEHSASCDNQCAIKCSPRFRTPVCIGARKKWNMATEISTGRHAVVVICLSWFCLPMYHVASPWNCLSLSHNPAARNRRTQWIQDKFLDLEGIVRQQLTEFESRILESRLPVTVEVNQNGEEVTVAHPHP